VLVASLDVTETEQDIEAAKKTNSSRHMPTQSASTAGEVTHSQPHSHIPTSTQQPKKRQRPREKQKGKAAYSDKSSEIRESMRERTFYSCTKTSTGKK
jgi:hypothetical protein